MKLTPAELSALEAMVDVGSEGPEDVVADAEEAMAKLKDTTYYDFALVAHSAYFTEYRTSHNIHDSIDIRFPSGYWGKKQPPDVISIAFDFGEY